MKAIYIKEVNKMREIPEMGKPTDSNSNYRLLWEDENGAELAKEYEDEYNKQLAACKEYPCPPQHSFVEGVTYEEGKDYEIEQPINLFIKGDYSNKCTRCGCIFHGTDKLWFMCEKCGYAAIAIPINKESEDEMWLEIEKLIPVGSIIKELKSKLKSMTTQEGNKLIAEFLQLESRKPSWSMAIQFNRNGYWIPVGTLEYHTSWDWLRPVIDKIFEYALAYPEETHKVIDMRIVVNIDAAWEKSVEFIKFINSKTKTPNHE
jgi:hypothetical protein